MTHKRQDIRDAIIAAINGATIVAATSVFSNRGLSIWDQDLPAINVTTLDEPAVQLELSQKLLKRDLQVEIIVVAVSATDAAVDDTLDTLAAQIEAAMTTDALWNGPDVECTLTNTQLVIPDEPGEVPMAGMKLSYTARYIS